MAGEILATIFPHFYLKEMDIESQLTPETAVQKPEKKIPKTVSCSSCDSSENRKTASKDKLEDLSKIIFQIGVMATVTVVVALGNQELEAVDQFFVLGNMLGCVCIFSGLLLREITPRFARAYLVVGVGLVFAAIIVLFSKHLLWWLRFVPAVCYPFVIMAVLAVAAKGEEGDSLEELFYCII
ncbi:PREDICTED: uncharacterized protein LOC109153306 isoform X2 [Ipomoea nil]|uniref:uncharacterized protein LOC109153306 isoform X2 n=1 Tax=Ipomoea nil TaxID=35883 RepID=UPI000900F9D4|nr:PREDICTED: uncharacterized protein LOC109153306 isoform X2 [Ipomoea nil]